MNEPRSQLSRIIHIQHPTMTIAPSQMRPFVHHYPIKDGDVITTAPQNPFFQRKQTIFTKRGRITLTKSVITIPASRKASNRQGNARKLSRTEANIDGDQGMIWNQLGHKVVHISFR